MANTSKSKPKKYAANRNKKPSIPYHRKPENLTLDQWQEGLRRQFAGIQSFEITNLGSEPVFSDYEVKNLHSGSTYKVAIRSNPNQVIAGQNNNFCACYDFKTNGLGTCKHIEAVLLQICKKRDLKKRYKTEQFAPAYSSVFLKYTSEGRKVMLRIGTLNNQKMKSLSKSYFHPDGSMKVSGLQSFDVFIQEAKQLDPDFRCYEDAMSYIIGLREKVNRKAWIANHKQAIDEGMLAKYIKATLHPYQREGVCFALESGRVLIADEMGLGKTIQAIAATEVFHREFHVQKVLVVCPTSLKYQWKSEIEKFTESSVQVIEGNRLKRLEQYANDSTLYQIVSHHIIGYDLKEINEAGFDLIILDEAQRIKNWKTKISQNIKKLSSEYAIVLTGTPLENKLEELYSIVQFIDPFRLGALFRFLYNHQITDPETTKVIGYKDLNQVGEILADLMIRRTKKKVLRQLPDRQDKNLFVPMTDEQQAAHDECYDTVCRLVNRWRKMGFLPEKDRQRLMINLNMMRMVCDSTFVLDQKTRHDTKISELMGILEEIFEISGEKVVIFSQWERMTRLVAKELEDLGIRFENLHGGIPSKDRRDLLDNFMNDPDSRVFLSTDAGGVGLNLQSAAYLINLDIPWNPAVLEQRIARIFRMGQKKKVNIINLVSNGTIEHRMLDVLRFKSSMAEGVLDGGDDAIMMQEDRFRQFMNSVESVVDEIPRETFLPETEDSAELKETYQRTPDSQSNLGFDGKQMGLFDDEAPKASKKWSPVEESGPGSGTPDWMVQLAKAFADPKMTKQLAQTFTEKNEKTGQTFFKLPVENEEVVENVLNSLGQLFKAMDWQKIGK
ncbi:MAG: DEAD/DEAH box helicase [Lunatimonas sp.]|uniref:DEAD/DEAH box helicase n=1 Tax=Lunatimonas sp. TaxID=2060141 RepID=UPI00263B2AB9|nr:DEAD/DEAH box helicase [Lunatimonas sp.]MCC5936940.1 DEAD/DEAH box helicase [Lunatimonas sp.]